MAEKVYNVLFICTQNSARSIMAEGILNSLAGGRFVAYSAGSHPAGEVHPLALATLESMRMPTEGYRSKDWSEFAVPGAPGLPTAPRGRRCNRSRPGVKLSPK